MSTSPEAKQAAEVWEATYPEFEGPSETSKFCFELGYDAATAKLREELKQLAVCLNCGVIQHDQIDRICTTCQRAELMSLANLHKILAHQQPSLVKEQSSHAVSAPTPDVEKLEWKLWSRGDNRVTVVQNNEIESIITPEPVSSEQGELLRKKHNKALVQARAPFATANLRLVAALRRMPELAYEVILQGDSSITVENLPNELQCICDAALQQ